MCVQAQLDRVLEDLLSASAATLPPSAADVAAMHVAVLMIAVKVSLHVWRTSQQCRHSESCERTVNAQCGALCRLRHSVDGGPLRRERWQAACLLMSWNQS